MERLESVRELAGRAFERVAVCRRMTCAPSLQIVVRALQALGEIMQMKTSQIAYGNCRPAGRSRRILVFAHRP